MRVSAVLTPSGLGLALALVLGPTACSTATIVSETTTTKEAAGVPDAVTSEPSVGTILIAATTGADAPGDSAYPANSVATDNMPTTIAPSPNPFGHPSAASSVQVAIEKAALESSSHAQLLGELQAALEMGDAASLAARIDEGRGGLKLYDVRAPELGALSATLPRLETELILGAMLAEGPAPRVHGYFDATSGSGEACVYVVMDGFGDWPKIAAHDLDDQDRTLSTLALQPAAAAFTLCDDGASEWYWRDWIYGDFRGELLSQLRQIADSPMPYEQVR